MVGFKSMVSSFWFAFYGLLGGFLRGLVGIVKYYEKNRREGRFRLYYFLFSLFVASLVGLVAGLLADSDPTLSFLAGYAGTDFLEGLYKIKFAQKFEI